MEEREDEEVLNISLPSRQNLIYQRKQSNEDNIVETEQEQVLSERLPPAQQMKKPKKIVEI